jgi:hypothetical protein
MRIFICVCLIGVLVGCKGDRPADESAAPAAKAPASATPAPAPAATPPAPAATPPSAVPPAPGGKSCDAICTKAMAGTDKPFEDQAQCVSTCEGGEHFTEGFACVMNAADEAAVAVCRPKFEIGE